MIAERWSCPYCRADLRVELEGHVIWWVCDPCRLFALTPSPWHSECETYDSSLPPRLAFEDPSRPVELIWAGKYKNLGKPIPARRLHVHERIDPKVIVETMLATRKKAARPAARHKRRSRAPP